MLADAQGVVHFAGGQAERAGKTWEWETVGIFRVADGRITECWLLPFDQYAFEKSGPEAGCSHLRKTVTAIACFIRLGARTRLS